MMSFKIHQALNRPPIRGFLLKDLIHGGQSERLSAIPKSLKLLPSTSHNDLSLSLAALNINSIQTPPCSRPGQARIPPPPLPLSRIIQLPQISTNVSYEDQLPTKSIDDPSPSTVQEKLAARLIVIRRNKMKRHKLRKLRKKWKYEYLKIRQQRELKKEKAFQAELLGAIKLAKSFDPAKYAAEKIAKARKVELPIFYYGVKFPPHIIEQLIEREEKRKKEKEADEKRRASMSPYVKDYLDKLPK